MEAGTIAVVGGTGQPGAAMGLRGQCAGALVNSAAAGALTSTLMFLDKTCQVDGAGIGITGAPSLPQEQGKKPAGTEK